MKEDTLLKSIIVLIVLIMLPCSIGEMIHSFMDATTHTLHKMKKEGTIQWHSSSSSVSTPPEAKRSSFSGVSTPLETPNQKPSIWQPGYSTGICNTGEELHTRIGHVLAPFFATLIPDTLASTSSTSLPRSYAPMG